MNPGASYWIQNLHLLPHPEGGYFREIYRDEATFHPLEFSGLRSYSTAIYYLLQQGAFSRFHRIKSDEVWHHYAGEGVRIHLLENGQYRMLQLGKNIEKGELPVVWVPKGIWFAAEPAEGCDFSLMGCTVSPGFDFADFEMANRADLAKYYDGFKELIDRLTS